LITFWGKIEEKFLSKLVDHFHNKKWRYRVLFNRFDKNWLLLNLVTRFWEQRLPNLVSLLTS
jgi:hypothetical protein